MVAPPTLGPFLAYLESSLLTWSGDVGMIQTRAASVVSGGRRFEAARTAMDARVEDVVGVQQRAIYAATATPVVACAEPIALRGDGARTLEHVAVTHGPYRRRSAFRAALQEAVGSSSMLRPAR
jgi:hypothetical protein